MVDGLTPHLELDGLSPDRAFAILGNNTRLEILKALWKAGAHHEFDDIDDAATTISFSELQRLVDIQDNGQFNYHLSQLIPSFVRRSEEGYRLSGAGKRVFQAIIAISGEQDQDAPTDLETPCPVCGGGLTAVYEDQWLRVMCTICDGNFGNAAPDGTIFHSSFPAAGLSKRTRDEAYSTGKYRCMLDLAYLMRGICPQCASVVTSSVSACEAHDASGARSCTICGTHFVAWGDLRCETCRFAKRLPIELCAMGLTPVITFLYDQDIDVLSPSFRELGEVMTTRFDTVITQDPLRITIAIRGDADDLTLTFDRQLSIVENP